MQDILHYWHKCDAAALHCFGELCRFSHIHAARQLSPVWLCSRRLHVWRHGAAMSGIKGDTSAQKCFLSRKQRLGILPRSFNCKFRCKEDSCSKYKRMGIQAKPGTHRVTDCRQKQHNAKEPMRPTGPQREHDALFLVYYTCCSKSANMQQ